MGITGTARGKTVLVAALLALAGLVAAVFDAEQEFAQLLRTVSSGDVTDAVVDIQGTNDATGARAAPMPPLPDGAWYVSRVVDGDTLIAARGEETLRVRLIGIDAPESVHPTKEVACFGKEASAHLQELAAERVVTLQVDASQGMTDTYGRTLAYVIRDDGVNLNEQMLRDGFAYEYTYHASAPYELRAVFVDAQREARAAGRGLWAAGACAV